MPGFTEEKQGLAVWAWVGFVVLGTAVIMVIVLWGRQFLPQPEGPPPPPEPRVQTYRHEESGLAIDYPLDWQVASTSILGARAASAIAYFDGPANMSRAEEIRMATGTSDILESDVRLSVYPLSQIGNLDEYMLQGFRTGRILDPRKLAADYAAYGFTLAGTPGHYIVFAERGGIIYELFFGHRTAREELTQEEAALLGSLRFE